VGRFFYVVEYTMLQPFLFLQIDKACYI
jgi:hypothetical protein